MIALSFTALSAAVALGLALVSGSLGRRPCAWITQRRAGLLHGSCGAVGLAAFGLGLRRGAVGGVFAWDALGLIAIGLLLGIGMAAWAWRRPRPGALVALHASLGGIGYLLAAGAALG